MKLIAMNKDAIKVLSGENSLLDGNIEKIEIFQDRSVCINISFQMRISSLYKRILLKFNGCKEYHFSYSSDYEFYTVELIKFFQKNEELFYISFDPYDNENIISDEDQDLILCSEIAVFEI